MSAPSTDVTVNGTPRSVAEGSTLLALVADLTNTRLADSGAPADGSRLGVAAAVDGAVVPRSRWGEHALAPGQTIDIVTAVQGG